VRKGRFTTYEILEGATPQVIVMAGYLLGEGFRT
jgi:hypothetical protein